MEGLTLDTSGLVRKEEGEEYSSTVELSSFFCEGDWLYITGMVYMGTPYAVAGRMSLETGEKQDFACENLLSLAPVGDGTLMALVYDISALYSATTQVDLTQAAQYGLFDPEKDAVASLADLRRITRWAAIPPAVFAWETARCTIWTVPASRASTWLRVKNA